MSVAQPKTVMQNKQPLEALEVANHIRTEGARQRRALMNSTPEELTEALVFPSPELRRLRLGSLLAPINHRGPIPRFGRRGLHRAFAWLHHHYPLGREWHTEIRLGELTQDERRRLAMALRRKAPPAWRKAA